MVMERDASGYKFWRCLDCGYTQKLRKDVLKHIERRHLSLSINCTLCPATLSSRCELRTHMKSRHGDMPVAWTDPTTPFI